MSCWIFPFAWLLIICVRHKIELDACLFLIFFSLAIGWCWCCYFTGPNTHLIIRNHIHFDNTFSYIFPSLCWSTAIVVWRDLASLHIEWSLSVKYSGSFVWLFKSKSAAIIANLNVFAGIVCTDISVGDIALVFVISYLATEFCQFFSKFIHLIVFIFMRTFLEIISVGEISFYFFLCESGEK